MSQKKGEMPLAHVQMFIQPSAFVGRSWDVVSCFLAKNAVVVVFPMHLDPGFSPLGELCESCRAADLCDLGDNATVKGRAPGSF